MSFLILRSSISQGGGSGDTVTITGSGFGTKSPAAPHFYQRFTDVANGANYAAAGFDFLGSNTSNTVSQARADEGFNGSGSWRTLSLGDGGETFTHFGVHMPASNDRVTCMFWRRMVRTGAGTGTGQIKGTRCGSNGGFTGATDGSSMYGATPKWAASHYIEVDDITPPMVGGNAVPHYWTAGGSEVNITPLTEADAYVQDGNYHWHYTYMQLNTIGNANGIYVNRVGPTLYLNNTTQQIKSSASHYLDYCQPNPGYANAFDGCSYTIYHTYIYIDNSRAWAGFGDNADFDLCTGFIPIDLETWGDSQITGNLGGLGRPEGFDFVHVVTTDGTVIENCSYS